MTIINFANPYKENMTDPTGNREHALDMAARIEGYYHKNGYTWVSVSVLSIPIYNGNGDRIGNRYEMSSNIKFNTNNYLAKSKG